MSSPSSHSGVTDHRMYYDINGSTPDFTEMNRVAQAEAEERQLQRAQPTRKTILELFTRQNSPCLAQGCDDSPPYDVGRAGELPYEDFELAAIEARRQASKKELEEDLEEARRGAKQRTPPARNLARNIFPTSTPTPKRKKKAVRKESPSHTLSPPPPLVLSSKPDHPAWEQSQQSQQSTPTPLRRFDRSYCLYCLQEPCEQQEDIEDTRQRLSMYFPRRVYDRVNDIPGNFQRRRTFQTIYKDIAIAKGRDVYAKFLPTCVKASAHTIFPSEESLRERDPNRTHNHPLIS